jgi:phage baseplate assembly protein W
LKVADSRSFQGTGWGFPVQFVRQSAAENATPAKRACSRAGGVVMVSDETDIRQSLEILFNTSLGERVMQPTYGADLKDQMFEPMNGAVLTFIEDLLRTAIIYHEPRIDMDGLTFHIDPFEGGLTIEIDFRIRGTNSRFNFVYPFYLTETGQKP